eukprot:CAMPEP_0172392596 /NCGR_PEP_ID=MMETSP1061-20121228/8681_1 /TAXON_ID=37318 /ORGANISM="Pseudo-nitzschia pungens, Strain cf. pungens" /LENGTH=111 /DNA_ID=CAMNT_0013123465 /DNA_START=62 /DNA_END=398 /DNA_ORIENTATION=+
MVEKRDEGAVGSIGTTTDANGRIHAWDVKNEGTNIFSASGSTLYHTTTADPGFLRATVGAPIFSSTPGLVGERPKRKGRCVQWNNPNLIYVYLHFYGRDETLKGMKEGMKE